MRVQGRIASDVKRRRWAAVAAAVHAAAELLRAGLLDVAAEALAYRLLFALRASGGAVDRATVPLSDRAAGAALRRAAAAIMVSVEEAGLDLGSLSDDDISAAYEMSVAGRPSRRFAGVFYTPTSLGEAVVREAFRVLPLGHAVPRVLDPACGTGALLLAVGRRLVSTAGFRWREVVPSLHGWDIDPIAVEIARARLLDRAGWTLGAPRALDDLVRVVDSLAEPLPVGRDGPGSGFEQGSEAGYELVVANPPFGNAIGRGTARDDEERERYARRFPEAATGAYDRAGLFVELGVRLCRRDGVTAMIVPRALLAAPYAKRLRGWIAEGPGLRAIFDIAAADWFPNAAVHVTALVLGGRSAEAAVIGWCGPGELSRRLARIPESDTSRWAVALSPFASLMAGLPPEWPRLDFGTILRASATVAEAYELRDRVIELPEGDPEAGFRLITSGAIEPLSTQWGARPTRYLKRKLSRPWIPGVALSARRREQQSRPKVLVAGLSRVLEAVAVDGRTAGAVATLSLEPRAGTPHRLAALVCSSVVRAQFLAIFGPLALGGGSVQVTKKKLAEVRVPAALLAQGSPDGAARASELYERNPRLRFDCPMGRSHVQPDPEYVAALLACAKRIASALSPADVIAALDHLDESGLVGSELLGWADACVTAVDPVPLTRWLEASSAGIGSRVPTSVD